MWSDAVSSLITTELVPSGGRPVGPDARLDPGTVAVPRRTSKVCGQSLFRDVAGQLMGLQRAHLAGMGTHAGTHAVRPDTRGHLDKAARTSGGNTNTQKRKREEKEEQQTEV